MGWLQCIGVLVGVVVRRYRRIGSIKTGRSI